MDSETIFFLVLFGIAILVLIMYFIIDSKVSKEAEIYRNGYEQEYKKKTFKLEQEYKNKTVELEEKYKKDLAERERAIENEYNKKAAALSADINYQISKRKDEKLAELNRKLEEVNQRSTYLFQFEQTLNDREDQLSVRLDEVNHLNEREKQIGARLGEADRLKREYQERLESFSKYAMERIKDIFRSSSITSEKFKLYENSFFSDRGRKALEEEMKFENFRCTVVGESQTPYETTLESCTCPDNQIRKQVCKHMIALAIKTSTLPLGNFKKSQEAFIRKYAQKSSDLQDRVKEIEEHLLDVTVEVEVERESLSNILAEKERIFKLRNDALQSFSVSFPWLAEAFADLEERIDTARLASLPNRAAKAADTVKEMRAEKRALRTKVSYYENLLKTYEYLFPWLEDFSEVHLDDAMAYVNELSDDSYYENTLRKWLSPEEYANLSPAGKNQLALDRYMARKKTDWEAGIEYERYVGYLYETAGYSVKYVGALDGLQDMGRDLIAEKDGTVYVIQCKRWAQEKQIHEKHIFQIFGTTYALRMKNPGKAYVPVFYTTTELSPVAAQCADGLNVEVHASAPFEKYPLIKCNIGKDETGSATKIYHLPFDQQYDRVHISTSKGELYVQSVAEAEMHGFRHALRHTPE